MKATIKNWIKANCQDQPTDTKLDFHNLIKDTTKTVYLSKDYKGCLTDDLDDFGNFEWRAWGSNLSLIDDNLEIIIYDTNITNQVLY